MRYMAKYVSHLILRLIHGLHYTTLKRDLFQLFHGLFMIQVHRAAISGRAMHQLLFFIFEKSLPDRMILNEFLLANIIITE
jgi:hypothetical protein